MKQTLIHRLIDNGKIKPTIKDLQLIIYDKSKHGITDLIPDVISYNVMVKHNYFRLINIVVNYLISCKI